MRMSSNVPLLPSKSLHRARVVNFTHFCKIDGKFRCTRQHNLNREGLYCGPMWAILQLTQPMKDSVTAVYRDHQEICHADSFEPLKAAARAGTLDLVAWGHGLYPGRSFEDPMVPEVRSVGVWNAPKKQTWGLDWHRNEGIKFCHLERGKLDLATEKGSRQLHTGSLAILSPWQKHRLGNPHIDASVMHWLVLDVKVRGPDQSWVWPEWLVCSQGDLQRFTELLGQPDLGVVRGNQDLARCFQRIKLSLGLPEPEQVTARLKLHINELLILALEVLGQHEQGPVAHPGSYRAVEQFLFHLDHHLDHPWTLRDMAEACGLGRSQFSRYCLQIANMTPMDLLHVRRLEKATELLDLQDLSITEISNLCGFNSSQYFANSFKAFKGVTPSEYRRKRLLALEGSQVYLG